MASTEWLLAEIGTLKVATNERALFTLGARQRSSRTLKEANREGITEVAWLNSGRP